MNKAPVFKIPSLKGARVLLTNDDGIDAPGMKVLESIALALGMEPWVVAPEKEQSGAGHSLTLHDPLRWREINDRRFAVTGTPTDCVLMALNKFMADHPPVLILSGVNRGANMGDDVTYSGTIAAAIEGTLLGVPSIALSQVFLPGETKIHWRTAEVFAPDIIRKLCERGWATDVLMNLNFPRFPSNQVTGVTMAPQGHHKLGDELVECMDPRGRPYVWVGGIRPHVDVVPGSDLDCLENAKVTVTPLSVNLTDEETLERFAGVFDG